MDIWSEIKKLLNKDYPCLPAIKSLNRNQLIVIETNSPISGGIDISEYLRQISQRYIKEKEQYLSLWIVFDCDLHSEDEFERHLFRTLLPFKRGDHYYYGDSRLFVVGMHPGASRKARKFPFNSMVINLFEQFETLKGYQELIDQIRVRDIKYSGSINPMSLKHGDEFEEIQFSGKLNPDDWKIPE
jgi:uncharacterized protein